MLESDEMNQLLKNDEGNSYDFFTDERKKKFIETLKSAMSKTEKAFAKLVSSDCNILNLNIELINAELLPQTIEVENYYMQDFTYNKHFTSFVAEVGFVKQISGIVTQEQKEAEELDEGEKAAWAESINQMLIAFCSALEKDIKYKGEIQPIKDKESELLKHGDMFQISFAIKLGETEAGVYYYIPIEMGKEIIEKIAGNEPKGKKEEEAKEEEEEQATVQPIKFEDFTEEVIVSDKESIELLMDLQLQVSVELGKVKKTIRDILQFSHGTIVELDKLAGENVDILVSGKVIAKGEVVVVDQNFGVRITQIVTPEKRV